RERMSEQERKRVQQQVIRLLNVRFPAVMPDTWKRCERLLPHVLTCAATMPDQIGEQALGEVLRKAANFVQGSGQGALISPAVGGSWTTAQPVLPHAEPTTPPHLLSVPIEPSSVLENAVHSTALVSIPNKNPDANRHNSSTTLSPTVPPQA